LSDDAGADVIAAVVCDNELVLVLSSIHLRRIRGSNLNEFHVVKGSDRGKEGEDEDGNSGKRVGGVARASRRVLGYMRWHCRGLKRCFDARSDVNILIATRLR
jgi:hypothetical protein